MVYGKECLSDVESKASNYLLQLRDCYPVQAASTNQAPQHAAIVAIADADKPRINSTRPIPKPTVEASEQERIQPAAGSSCQIDATKGPKAMASRPNNKVRRARNPSTSPTKPILDEQRRRLFPTGTLLMRFKPMKKRRTRNR
jgi:hypothetical protein